MNPTIIARSQTLGERELKYVVQIPAGMKVDRNGPKIPLLVSLHGSGGHTFIDRLIDGSEKSVLIGDVDENFNYPLIVFAPRVPLDTQARFSEDKYWCGASELIIAALDTIIAEFNIDEDRVYLAGFSMGGRGTWNLASKYADRFAAIMPVAGWGTMAEIELVKNLPIWIFHTSLDPLVPFVNAKTLYNRLIDLDANVRLSVFPSEHEIDVSVFSEGTIRWLLDQSRPKNKKRMLEKKAITEENRRIINRRPSGHARFGMPDINGIDPIWDDCDFMKTTNTLMGDGSASAEFATMYDADNFYVCAKVTNVLEHDITPFDGDKKHIYLDMGGAGLNDDGVDFYFDFLNTKATVYVDGCVKFRITAGNQKVMFGDIRFTKISTSVCKTDVGYVIAIALPFPDGFRPIAGKVIGFDVHVNDTLGTDMRKGSMSWSDTTGNAWCSPLVFGDIELGPGEEGNSSIV